MAPTQIYRKRKAATPDTPESSDAESDAEFGDGVLEGILSQSEDDSEEHSTEDDDNEAEEDADLDDAAAVGPWGQAAVLLNDLDGFEGLDRNEIPSESEQSRRLVKTHGAKVDKNDPVIEQPAVGEEDDRPNYTVTTDANGGERYVYDEIDPVYDSDDSDAPVKVNTIGNIPLSFYDSYPHIGYDINGKKIMRPAKGEALDALLDNIEVPKGWTGLTDAATGKALNLSQEELEILHRIQINEVPEEGYDPYPVSVLL